MSKRYSITVRGKFHTWSFPVTAKSAWVEEWRNDDLEIEEIVNTIPVWAVDVGLLRACMFIQDLFYLQSPFGKSQLRKDFEDDTG